MKPTALRAALGDPVEVRSGFGAGERIEVFRASRNGTMIHTRVAGDSIQTWTVWVEGQWGDTMSALARGSSLDDATVGRISSYLRSAPAVPVTTAYYLYHHCYHLGMDSLMIRTIEGDPATRDARVDSGGRAVVVWSYPQYHHTRRLVFVNGRLTSDTDLHLPPAPPPW